MNVFWILLIAALVVSSVGFKKYIYFISIGYGFSVAVLGFIILFTQRSTAGSWDVLQCLLLVFYGCRLGGYLLARELKSASYRKTLAKETKDGSEVGFGVKIAIWITCAALYACQVSPVLFRMETEGHHSDVLQIIGTILMIAGIVLETAADLQKSAAKAVNPRRFVSTGLYRFVRCPNYFGEVLFWTGVFVSALNMIDSPLRWLAAIAGYAGIIYIMFSGAPCQRPA